MKDRDTINVDQIMGKIRRDSAAERTSIPQLAAKAVGSAEPAGKPPNSFTDGSTTTYSIHDFMKFDDLDFVENAYWNILKRGPDRQGFEGYLKSLRQGVSKSEILWRLRYSPEGKQKRVVISGLRIRNLVGCSFRIPVVGYLLNIIVSIARFPRTLQYIRQNIAATNVHLTQQQNTLKNLSANLEAKATQIQNTIESKADAHLIHEVRTQLSTKADRQLLEELDRQLAQKVNYDALLDINKIFSTKADASIHSLRVEVGEKPSFEELHRLLATKADSVAINDLNGIIGSKADLVTVQALQAELNNKADSGSINDLKLAIELKPDNDVVNELHNTLREIQRQTRDHKLNILEQQRMLSIILEEARKRFPEPVATEQLKTVIEEADHFLDAFYVSFEDQFRGTRGDIKEKQKAYLPYIDKVMADAKSGWILDVGCGRGEWLELLKETHYKARGIDRNRIVIQRCRELGLDVIEEDAIDYMRSQKSGCVNVITGFQIIEHLSPKSLVDLLDESLRLLKPGGMVIFETPNPENLIVGACNFYYDPSHRHPIPPPPLKFIAEQRGFVNAEILRLHPYEEFRNPSPGGESDGKLWNLFSSAQDYSIIAYKPKSNLSRAHPEGIDIG
jgi:SAM-dependent methyltransferase